ncbi:MAG: substrate-binding domain-containing protein [Cyanobacteria bacterium P01_E01_bin.42]
MLPQKKNISIARLLFQLTLAAASALAISLPMDSVAAQSLTPTISEGTIVRIDGSSSMATVNETLKEYIETKYPNTQVTTAYRGTQQAIAALRAGQIDVAAIGRPLTDAEKADGLAAYPLSRRKIAIVVSADNPFEGSLSHEQFARIFRGEIDNWFEVGGDRQPIRFLDRPETSDTRQAFQIYPVFQGDTFEVGENAEQLEKDSTAALIAELDANAIGYAIADQAINRPELRILLMHNAPVTEAAYPFSQPRYYAYRKDNPSAAARSFLGLITAADGQQAIASAQAGEQTAIAAGFSTSVSESSDRTPVSSSVAEENGTEENGETAAGVAAGDPEDARENEEAVAIAPANLPANSSASQPSETPMARADSTGEAQEEEDDSPLLWWVLAAIGLAVLVWLWLNQQKATSSANEAPSVSGQPPLIPLTPKPAEPTAPSQPEPTPTKTSSSPPVTPATPPEPPRVETPPSPPVAPAPPPEPPRVATPPSPPVVPPQPASNTPSQPEVPAVSPETIAGAVAIGAGAAAIAGREKEMPEPLVEPAINLPSNSYGTLTVNSSSNCYVLDANQLAYLESGANTFELDPGVYVIRIESGAFNYWPEFQQKFAGEPWVLLWLYGGKFINKKTNLPVACSWSALNGYDDTLTLEVLETIKLSALFFDTYKDDNEGQITLSILKDE